MLATICLEQNNPWSQRLLRLVVVRILAHFVSLTKQYRIRAIDNILDEIEDCISIGITEVHFIDDLFSPNSQWVLKFCDAVERRGLKFNWGYKTTIAGTTREQLRRCADTGCTRSTLV